jgi:tetratricopeptide (TPR) repeat protein
MPSAQGPDDEQKEPYFLTGKARENTLDFKGAIEAFEKALEANPQNASAHFELGLRYEKEMDYSAAIYHFERFLRLRPDSDRAQLVKDRITQNKMELSKTTVFGPLTQNLTREFEKLAEENKQLRAELEKLRASQPGQAEQTGPARQSGQAGTSAARQPTTSLADPAPSGTAVSRQGGAAYGGRLHAVKAGDTATSIARKYGIKLETFMAANPTLDPKRMKVGQSVRIPSP